MLQECSGVGVLFCCVCEGMSEVSGSCLSIDLHVVVHLGIKLISSLGLTSLALRAASTTATTTTTTTTTAGTLGALLSLVLVVAGRSPRK